MRGPLPREEFGSVREGTTKSYHKKVNRFFSHLKPPRVSTYECEHGSIYGQQRVLPIQQFRLSGGCEPVTDIVFDIAGHLLKLLAVFRRLRGTRMSGPLFLYTKVIQNGARGGRKKLLLTSLKNTLLPLQFSFDELEVGNMFDGDVPHHEQELAQFKGIALVVPGVVALCAFLRALRFWLRSRLLILIHSVRIICAGVRGVASGSVLLPKGPLGEVPDDSVTELVRFLCQGVDRIDCMFSHPKPIG